MVEYKIFIDHQYTTIYNGEFSNCIFQNIIKPLSNLGYEMTISTNETDTINILSNNNFDLIICTGYSGITYSTAFAKSGLKKTAKFIQIIYDMNAEKIIEYADSANISKIISQKSKLIILADKIIIFSNIIKQEIETLYKEYENLFNIKSKLVTLDYFIEFKEYKKSKSLIKEKYIIIDTSINGATFLMPEFRKILNDISNEKLKYKIVLIAENLPKDLYNKLISTEIKNNFILLTEINTQDLANLYKYALISIFPSTIDTNLEKIYLSIKEQCITIFNSKNNIYKEFFKNVSMYVEEENLPKTINRNIKTLKLNKDILIKEQNQDLDKIIINSTNRIENLVHKIRTVENNKRI